MKIYEEIAQQLDRLASTGAFQRANVEAVKAVVAGKLKLKLRGSGKVPSSNQ